MYRVAQHTEYKLSMLLNYFAVLVRAIAISSSIFWLISRVRLLVPYQKNGEKNMRTVHIIKNRPINIPRGPSIMDEMLFINLLSLLKMLLSQNTGDS